MITTLKIDKITITIEGNGTGFISDYVKGRLDNAFNQYNNKCERLKAEYSTTLPELSSIEKEWLNFQDWIGVYNIVVKFLHSPAERRMIFPNRSGYIERIKP